MENSVTSFLPVLACLASLLAVPLILIFRKEPFLREASTFLAGFAKLGFVLAMVPIVLSGKVIEYTFVEGIAGISVPIMFRVDGLGMTFALVASSLWLVTSLYVIGYMRGLKEHSQTRFFCFFALSLSATLGVAFAGNLLTLYLFYELLSLSTWPLVTHHQDKEARGGGRTYLTHLLGTSVAFGIPAITYTYFKSGGDLSFAGDAMLAGSDMSYLQGVVLLLAFAFGFSKAGLMPFHSWLPGAMVAPTPVSALLHAVAVVKVGVFCVIRVVTGVFGTGLLEKLGANLVLCWIAAFTVVTSSLIAMSQDNLKRRLAFSTIGQLSYIILGVALLAPYAVQGSMMHIAMHAFGKITLFFCAGAIFVATGKKYISQLDGLGKVMPWTMGAFAIGAMSVTGLPPTGGLLSKIYMIRGAADAQQFALLAVYLVSSVLNGVYFFPIVYRAFFKSPATGELSMGIKEAPPACVIPLTLTAIASVLLFFFPGLLFDLTALMLPGK
ncbi:monovalent cation/H+ antiporter subunit D family protein [Verrucomicrobiales bacterium]|jgi:multicomponent Na+:H+ antiporter subunit D|nr:monovalent cation/H+ antiporter subunit D family protein [Verrucomicrobiales bacterium]MDA7926594.1 monovalent cation/H+ antiporter subunit D family protein [Verrucomicrobiales bacterium]